MLDPKAIYKTKKHGYEVRIYAHGDYTLMGAMRVEGKWLGAVWRVSDGRCASLGGTDTKEDQAAAFGLVLSKEYTGQATPITKWCVFGNTSVMAYDTYDKAKSAAERTNIAVHAIVPVSYHMGEGLEP